MTFRRLLIAAVAALCGAGITTAKVIKSPAYEFRKSGYLKVTGAEVKPQETRLTFLLQSGFPNISIPIEKSYFEITIPGDSIRMQPVAIEGAPVFGEPYLIPESGSEAFTVIYQPLPKGVKKIDTGAESNYSIFGIDLSGKRNKQSKAEKKIAPTPYRPISTIFASDTITLSGQIKGYDPRSGISVMELNIDDFALGRSKPVAIPVKADGSFSRRFYLPMAQQAALTIKGNVYVSLYLEPQNDLELLIDYDRLLDRITLRENAADAYSFGGSLAEINSELNAAPPADIMMSFRCKDLEPQQAKSLLDEHHNGIAQKTENYIAESKVSPKAAALLRNGALSLRVADMLNYADYYTDVPALPEDFYADELARVFHTDSTILATDCNMLLNRIGFAHVLPESRVTVNVPNFRKLVECITGNGGEFTTEELKQIRRVADFNSPDSLQDCEFGAMLWSIDALNNAAERIDRGEEFRTYARQMEISTPKRETNREFIQRISGSEELPAVWQFALSAKEGSYPEDFLPEISAHGITIPYIIEHLTEASQPKPDARALPENEAGMLMRNLIKPFEGKYLLVDFWDFFCGPCRAGIEGNKERRERHRGNPGFAFLFLASENGSPLEKYNAYVEKNLKGERVMRLPDAQMTLLRELFEFNAIPRYVLFNPDGKVVNSHYNLYEFWELLKKEGIIDESGDN